MQKIIQNNDNNLLIITGAALSLIAIVVSVLPINEVNAEQCNSRNNADTNDQNNNSNDDRICTNQQNHYSNTKDTTPFVLPAPFP